MGEEQEVAVNLEIEGLKAALAQRDKKVAKLKSLLTRSMRSDKRREEQVEALQLDITEKERQIHAASCEIKEKTEMVAKQSERLAELESKIIEMGNRLQTGVGSEAAQKRNERMKQMLERSNLLYADLQSRFQKVCSDLESEKEKSIKRGKSTRVIILPDGEHIVLNDDGTYASVVESPAGVPVVSLRAAQRQIKAGKKEDGSLPNLLVYLRKILLEFFVGDALKQVNLIPVILQLLECTTDQIGAAQRGFTEGRQFITSAFGI
jgi:hypothetical protein